MCHLNSRIFFSNKNTPCAQKEPPWEKQERAIASLSGASQYSPGTDWRARKSPPPLCTELCKNIPAKIRESLSKCFAAHPKYALRCNILVCHSRNPAEMCLRYFVPPLSPPNVDTPGINWTLRRGQCFHRPAGRQTIGEALNVKTVLSK